MWKCAQDLHWYCKVDPTFDWSFYYHWECYICCTGEIWRVSYFHTFCAYLIFISSECIENSKNSALLDQYQAILKIEPGFENVLRCLNEDPTKLDNFIREVCAYMWPLCKTTFIFKKLKMLWMVHELTTHHHWSLLLSSISSKILMWILTPKYQRLGLKHLVPFDILSLLVISVQLKSFLHLTITQSM